jgi:hypothetical protein
MTGKKSQEVTEIQATIFCHCQIFGSLRRNESERHCQGPQALASVAEDMQAMLLGRVPRPCASYYLDKQSACDRRGEVDSATSLGTGRWLSETSRNVGGSCHIDSSLSWSLDSSFLLHCLACHSLACSQLEPLPARVPPPTKRSSCLTTRLSTFSHTSPPHGGIHTAPPASSIP